MRPPPKCLPRVAAHSTIVYLTAAVVNLIYGSNYCYNGPSLPDHPTPVDWLGPWPGRIFTLWLLVMGVHVMMGLLARGSLHVSPLRRARARARFLDRARPREMSASGSHRAPGAREGIA